MATPDDHDEVLTQRRDQVLKLVARGFFKELVNYGMGKEEIMRVASNLLDGLLLEPEQADRCGATGDLALTAGSVTDEWQRHRRLIVGDVTLRPLEHSLVPRLLQWLDAPSVREAFVPAFPDSE